MNLVPPCACGIAPLGPPLPSSLHRVPVQGRGKTRGPRGGGRRERDRNCLWPHGQHGVGEGIAQAGRRRCGGGHHGFLHGRAVVAGRAPRRDLFGPANTARITGAGVQRMGWAAAQPRLTLSVCAAIDAQCVCRGLSRDQSLRGAWHRRGARLRSRAWTRRRGCLRMDPLAPPHTASLQARSPRRARQSAQKARRTMMPRRRARMRQPSRKLPRPRLARSFSRQPLPTPVQVRKARTCAAPCFRAQ